MTTLAEDWLSFAVPQGAVATEPPEAHGISRDGVRLLVSTGKAVTHARFSDLGRFLRPGDVLVVNTSATLPAALDVSRSGHSVVAHFSTPLQDGSWLVELRAARRADGPLWDVRAGERIDLPEGGWLTMLGPYGPYGPYGPLETSRSRIWRAEVTSDRTVEALLLQSGRPITYSYVPRDWPLTAYQTVFARDPGSAEMPSAARPFTPELVSEVVARGVIIAPVTLHTGVSSLDKGEEPLPERYAVSAATAAVVSFAHARGGRIIAVGTTATRALETVTDDRGVVGQGAGWTDLVLGPDRPSRVVDGIISGWHEPGASHLQLLEAVAGRDVVALAYDEAVREGYLWHEFGDSALLLPEQPGAA